MYHLFTPLSQVKGIGPSVAAVLAHHELHTVKDLLCFVPLRYEDRSQRVTIDQLVVKQLVTFVATVKTTNNFYRGRRSIQSATVFDDTGKIKLMWFNNRFIIQKLQVGQAYLFSGELNDKQTITQPVVEDIKEVTIHTDRLVPIYSNLQPIKQGTVRRLLRHILDNLDLGADPIPSLLPEMSLSLPHSFDATHFPDLADHVIQARERLALEELLSLMQRSQEIKQAWKTAENAPAIHLQPVKNPASATQPYIPATVPFTLTTGQLRSLSEIFSDLQHTSPMNRLLIGDVGSGKTVVAGLAALQVLMNQSSVALIAPTRILAEQHAQTIQKLFPQVKLAIITAQSKTVIGLEPQLYIGTHAAINKLAEIKPAFIIYDEQHRFGVNQRSQSVALSYSPHILTMSATPIPRSLMLTIFSHLQLSLIEELPAGRQPTKTWVVPERKRTEGFTWIADQLAVNQGQGQAIQQAIVICPFIDPSSAEALENIAAVNQTFADLQQFYLAQPDTMYKPRLGLLHGRLKKTEQNQVIEQLYAGQIDLLVTTPIVEVGIDLPAATIIVIEAAERFGLASLHQLRGRVGRAGQQGYCLLFSQSKNLDRLHKFSKLSSGSQIAELDLEYRGAGDIFGTQQHGFDQLRFASWTNTKLISQARQVFDQLQTQQYRALFYEPKTDQPLDQPLAN